MKNASKLSFDQRCKIEEMINLRKRKFEIADEIGKTRSTVAREIKRHRRLKPSNLFKYLIFFKLRRTVAYLCLASVLR